LWRSKTDLENEPSKIYANAEDAMKRSAITWSLLALIQFSSFAARATSLPFLQDDFETARATAIERKLPIFVEAWAPW